MNTTVIIVDDHQIFREGLRVLLEKQSGYDVIDEADNGRDAVVLAIKRQPDIVIMDVGMQQLNGIDATKQIVRRLPGVKVLALSMHTDTRFVVEMLNAGAVGYLVKNCAYEELARAMQTLGQGEIYLSPAVATPLIREHIQPGLGEVSTDGLTGRQREVLQLIAEGNNTSKIAETLNISVKTVESHRKQIMDRLGVDNVAELTKFAVRRGLTTLEP